MSYNSDPTRTMEFSQSEIIISWDYNDSWFSEIKDDVKRAGARWNSTYKHWILPPASIKAAKKIAEEYDFSVTGLEEAEKRVDAAIQASRAADADIDIPAPEGLSYLPYQRAGVAYALGKRDILIGDEMGLGKTIQALGVINAKPEIERVLVVCPASLKLNWRREAQKWLVRERPVVVIDGGKKQAEIPSGPAIVIINYELLGKHHELGSGWDLAVFDESHYLKNGKAQRTKAALSVQSESRIFLTGTPILNRPVELWPILESTGVFSNWWRFTDRYCDAEQHRWGRDVSGSSNLDELQTILREKIMVRRLKKDVLTDLPAKIRQSIVLDAESREEKAAIKREIEILRKVKAAKEALKADRENPTLRGIYTSTLGEIAEARHQTALAKLPRVAERAKELLESGEAKKIIVFGHHLDVIRGLKEELREFFPVSLTGEDSIESRQSAVDTFQGDKKCKVFIGGIRAAGVGITLTEASTVIFAELDWTPAAMSQAEDRAHRIGQKDSVLVITPLLDGSIDAKMSEKLAEKQRIIEATMDKSEEKQAAQEEISIDFLLEGLEPEKAAKNGRKTVGEVLAVESSKPKTVKREGAEQELEPSLT